MYYSVGASDQLLGGVGSVQVCRRLLQPAAGGGCDGRVGQGKTHAINKATELPAQGQLDADSHLLATLLGDVTRSKQNTLGHLFIQVMISLYIGLALTQDITASLIDETI